MQLKALNVNSVNKMVLKTCFNTVWLIFKGLRGETLETGVTYVQT